MDILAKCEDILRIKKPVNILFKPKMRNASGKYWSLVNAKGKLVKHLIHISRETGDIRSLEELIIHEYIHAWQAENGFTDNHGSSFQFMACSHKWHDIVGCDNNIWLPEFDGGE